MSLTASFVILIVLIFRLLLKRAPKAFSYALWGIVLFRLICPVTLNIGFSFVPSSLSDGSGLKEATSTYTGNHITAWKGTETYDKAVEEGVVPSTIKDSDDSYVVVAEDGVSEAPTVYSEKFPIYAMVWAIGIGCMLIYSLIFFIRLKKRLVGSIPLNQKERIYLSDYIDTPFVIGQFRPRIYLPSCLNEKEMEYILLHEKHHIKRKDHWFKFLGFIVLIIHWFNPLVWLAFTLASKDMEMSCDEAVMRMLGVEISADYSESLLSLATGRRNFLATPLAFGEGDTKARIKNVLNWKKPGKWIMIFAVTTFIVASMGCIFNGNKNGNKTEIDDAVDEKNDIYSVETYSQIVEDEDTIYHVEQDDETDRRIDYLDINVQFPYNDSWISSFKFYKIDDNNLKFTYQDLIAEADCELYVVKNGKTLLDFAYDDSLTEEWEGRTGQNEVIPVEMKYGADKKKVVVSWEYGEYDFLIYGKFTGDSCDGSSVAKTALYIVGQLN